MPRRPHKHEDPTNKMNLTLGLDWFGLGFRTSTWDPYVSVVFEPPDMHSVLGRALVALRSPRELGSTDKTKRGHGIFVKDCVCIYIYIIHIICIYCILDSECTRYVFQNFRQGFNILTQQEFCVSAAPASKLR